MDEGAVGPDEGANGLGDLALDRAGEVLAFLPDSFAVDEAGGLAQGEDAPTRSAVVALASHSSSGNWRSQVTMSGSWVETWKSTVLRSGRGRRASILSVSLSRPAAERPSGVSQRESSVDTVADGTDETRSHDSVTDMWIAARARERGLVLFARHAHFQEVDGLLTASSVDQLLS